MASKGEGDASNSKEKKSEGYEDGYNKFLTREAAIAYLDKLINEEKEAKTESESENGYSKLVIKEAIANLDKLINEKKGSQN